MWTLYCLDCLFAAIVLYLPGFFVFRAIGFNRAASFAFAPLYTALATTVTVFAFAGTGLQANWVSVCVGIALLTAVVGALFYLFFRTKRAYRFDLSLHLLLVTIACSAIIALLYFVIPLDSAASFYQENDNIAHLTEVRTFLDTGVFCLDSILAYPALWRSIAAVVASFGDAQVTVAANALNTIIIVLMYPASMAAFMQLALPDKPRAQIFACALVSCFAIFPWGLLLFGPLYPNVLGCALLPLVMVAFMEAAESYKASDAVRWFLLFFAGCALLVYAHPNALFTGVVVLVPYCIWTINNRMRAVERSVVGRAGACLAFALLVAGLWTIAYKLPFMKGVVSFDWPSYTTVPRAVMDVLSLAINKACAPQWVLAVFVIIGLSRALFSRRELWLVGTYSFIFVIFIADAALGGSIQHYLAGFWYSDSFRVAACFVYVLVPLAALGLDAVVSCVSDLVGRRAEGNSSRSVTFARAFGALCLGTVILFPNFNIPGGLRVITGFGRVGEMLTNGNSLASNMSPLDGEEIDFIERVHRLVGSEPVLNYPFDGSAYAYAVDDLNVLNRAWYKSKNPTIALASKRADEVEADPGVTEAFSRENIRYVLLLDYDRSQGGLYAAGGYNQDDWTGLEDVNDATPGYRILLSEGDMRLYEIE